MCRVPKSKRGKFLENSVKIELHEKNAAMFLTLFGFNIEVVQPVNTPGMRNPDFLIDGVLWEMKSFKTCNLKTIKKQMYRASLQATHIIIDLREVKKEYEKVEREVTRRFCNRTSFKRMIMITREGQAFDYRK